MLVDALEMHMLTRILGGFMSVGIIALIVVFQPEIRKFLLMIGSTNFGKKSGVLGRFKFLANTVNENTTDTEAIIDACVKMGSSKTGALIVLERNNNLDFLIETGDEMNIKVTQPILESIFFKNSPLHDGAIIIANNIIKATRVILPVTNKKSIPSRFGLRHKAAIGITEKTDALAVVISEENGKLSLIKNGELISIKNSEILKSNLETELQ